MDTKIFLQGFNSKKSVNTSEGLNISLKGKRRLLPTNDVAEVISQYDQYREEREKCNIIRLTCQVNPICSNVLFNRVSEIMKDEGSSAITYLNYGIFSGDTEDGEISEKIRYKKRDMSFWSGNTLHYQSIDQDITNLSKSTSLSDLTAYIKHNTDGLLDESSTSHPTNAIRDMQLSNDGFVYHCGLDILNNHLIRSNTFKTVCRMPDDYDAEEYDDEYGAFNTIADLMRDVNGRKVVEKLPFPVSAGVPENTKFITMHLYEYDDLYTFEDAVKNRLIPKYNGWLGFENRPKIKSYELFSIDHKKNVTEEEKELEIEKPIMYMNGGDFVDMYPDRTLYSFVPKFNTFRNRVEKNWNYCLTYPSSSTTEGFEDIIEPSNSSLKVLYFNENTRADNGTTQLVIYSVAKHGLSVGDYVNIYNNTKDEEGNTINTKVLDNAEVSDVVDEYIFTVSNADTQISNIWVELTESDLSQDTITLDIGEFNLSGNKKYYYSGNSTDTKYYIINNTLVNFDSNAQHLSYKKVVNDIECEYYVRIFSKIPNFKNASADTSSEYQIYKNDEELIHIYQDHKYDFESHVSRLAFAKNIYTDEVGEIVFTDDIDISNLKDNLGRPLSSIYLTIVKNNKGYKEWYGFDYNSWKESDITSDNIEFSHCFGRITCGLKTCDESIYDDSINNIHKLNEKNKLLGYDISAINGDRVYTFNRGEDEVKVEIADNEVWFDQDKHYYGDLSYYDNYNAVERHIEPIMHRVNTAQRESIKSMSSKYYERFVYDEISNDDYDKDDKYNVKTHTVDRCHDKSEGYYYIPHYEIRIKAFDKLETMLPDFLTMRSLINTDNGAKITTLQNHYLSIGDKSIIYDMEKNKYYYCTTVKGNEDNDKVFTCRIYDENGKEVLFNDLFASYNVEKDDPSYNSDDDIYNFKLFKMDNLNAPSYARVLKDGTCRVIWRNIVNNGFNLSDKTIEEYPFTNGAFYINRRIDLYLRRQDPYDLYGLYSEDDLFGNEIDIEKVDNYVKEENIEC